MTEAAGLFGEFAAAFVALLLVVAFFGLRSGGERRALFWIGVSSYLLRAALVPIHFWILEYGGYEGFATFDSTQYHDTAKEMAVEIALGLPKDSRGWAFKDPGYSFISAVLYVVFGTSTLVARFFNAAIGAMTILYVHRIAKTAFDDRVARTAVLLTAFLPYQIFLTLNQVKDGWVFFLATLLFWHGYRVMRELPGWQLSALLVVLGLVPMYFLRQGFILPFGAVMLLSFVFTQRSLVLGALMAVFVFVGLAIVQVTMPEGDAFALGVSADRLQSRFDTQAFASQRGGLLRYAKMTSFYQVYKVPLAALLLAIMPFPPRIGLGSEIKAAIMTSSQFLFVLLLPQLLGGVRECFRAGHWKRRVPLVIYAGMFMAVLGALSVGVIRYRETVFPVLTILTAAGIRSRQNLLLILVVYAGLVLLAAVGYFSRFG